MLITYRVSFLEIAKLPFSRSVISKTFSNANPLDHLTSQLSDKIEVINHMTMTEVTWFPDE